jgi:hypothetical protein
MGGAVTAFGIAAWKEKNANTLQQVKTWAN